MVNKTAAKALYILSQPLSVGAILLLLINDHLLRIYWPSWWTGKIGDFAWLYFTPFALAAILAWLIPSHWKHHETTVFALAFALTGGVFSLANTSAMFHLWLINLLENILGTPISLRRDPTDIIALISLVMAWQMWIREKRSQHKSSQTGLTLIPVAALLTIANMAVWPDNRGIECLVLHEDRITAYTESLPYVDTAFESQDGGYSWQTSSDSDRTGCTPFENNETLDPSNPDIRYRFTNPNIIEFSSDGGATWQEDFLIEPIGEVEETLIRKTHHGPIILENRLLDTIIDPASGNLLLAMGHRGLLMREANGNWNWMAVGPYEHIEKTRPEDVRFLIDGHILLAISFLLLSISTAFARINKRRLLTIALGIFWTIWLYSVLCSSPINMIPSGRGYDMSAIIYWGLIYLTLGLSLLRGLLSLFILFRDHRKSLWRILIAATIGAVIFIVPFILWAYMLIPNYSTAVIIGCTLPIIPLIVGDQWHRLYVKPDLNVEKDPEDKLDSDT
jgi:hypothetical protein